MSERFADTFYYIALLNRRDRMHARAVESTREHTGKMVTTTAVLTELADALRAPLNGEGLLASWPACRPIRM